jgi:hypothetical protein
LSSSLARLLAAGLELERAARAEVVGAHARLGVAGVGAAAVDGAAARAEVGLARRVRPVAGDDLGLARQLAARRVALAGDQRAALAGSEGDRGDADGQDERADED